jgi:hypothetical protein
VSKISIEKGAVKLDFSDYYPGAVLYINLNRTLRVPDVADGGNTRSKLPPGLGTFELVSTQSLGSKFPADQPAGIVMPMFQSEAVWFGFGHNHVKYPFLIKVAAGGINAVTGDVWQDGPAFGVGGKQDYVTAPKQPWIDGFKTGEGIVRQFVAAPLGRGLTVEEQLRGEVKFGGIQFVVHPIDKEYFERVVLPERARNPMGRGMVLEMCAAPTRSKRSFGSMGLAAGGQIEQRIEKDPYGAERWEASQTAALFVHIANSKDWQELTGRPMPREPLAARDYTLHGGKWFDYYSETDVSTAPALAGLKSVGAIADAMGLPTDSPVAVSSTQVVDLTPPQGIKQWGGNDEKGQS